MKKRILCTLIFSLLVLTACSSDTPNATPDEITPSAIVETKVEEIVRETVAPTEETTESIEAQTVVVTTESDQQAEVEIVERTEKTKAPAPAQKLTQKSAPKPTTKSTQKPTEKAKEEPFKEESNSSNNEQDIQNMVSYIISHNQRK